MHTVSCNADLSNTKSIITKERIIGACLHGENGNKVSDALVIPHPFKQDFLYLSGHRVQGARTQQASTLQTSII